MPQPLGETLSDTLVESVEEKLVLTILELAAALNRRGDTISEKVGITTQQWIILLYIYGDPNIPYIGKKHREGEFVHNSGMLASGIAEALNVSRPNVTNIVNSLIKKDLVLQSEDTDDRRRKLLKLTPKGIALLERIEPHRRRANIALFSRLSGSQQTDMLAQLQKLLQVLNGQEGV